MRHVRLAGEPHWSLRVALALVGVVAGLAVVVIGFVAVATVRAYRDAATFDDPVVDDAAMALVVERLELVTSDLDHVAIADGDRSSTVPCWKDSGDVAQPRAVRSWRTADPATVADELRGLGWRGDGMPLRKSFGEWTATLWVSAAAPDGASIATGTIDDLVACS